MNRMVQDKNMLLMSIEFSSVNIRQVQGDVAIPRVRFMKGRGQVAPAQVSWKSLAMSIEGSPREES